MPLHYPGGPAFLFLWIHEALISGIPLLINGNAGECRQILSFIVN